MKRSRELGHEENLDTSRERARPLMPLFMLFEPKSTKTAMRRMRPFSAVSSNWDDSFCREHLTSAI